MVTNKNGWHKITQKTFYISEKIFLYLRENFLYKSVSKRRSAAIEQFFYILVRKFLYIREKIFYIKVSQNAAIDYIFPLVPIDVMHMYLFPF